MKKESQTPILQNSTLNPPPGGVGGDTPQRLKFLSDLMLGVIIVLFIGFVAAIIAVGGIVNDYLAQKSASYQNLQDEMQTLNTKIDLLTHELEIQRLQTQAATSTP